VEVAAYDAPFPTAASRPAPGRAELAAFDTALGEMMKLPVSWPARAGAGTPEPATPRDSSSAASDDGPP